VVVLVRHGTTAWSTAGRHTSRTDVPLTRAGELQAAALVPLLESVGVRGGSPGVVVLSSPRVRARRTAELAGLVPFGVDEDLVEWDYGAYEGLTTAEIRREAPGWYLFRDGCPGGESVEAVGARADRVVARLKEARGHVILFGHGHFFRVLAARWLGLPASDARHFVLGTAALSILGYEHALDDPAILLWNDDRHAVP
jgi:broad specificity phosphatase PhoE